MEDKKQGKEAPKHSNVGRLTRKELYAEMCCRYHLQGYTNKEITEQIFAEVGYKMDPRTVSKHIREAVAAWKAKKDSWAAEITVVELEKINVLEAEYWKAYKKSCRKLKTLRKEYAPDPDFAPPKRRRGKANAEDVASLEGFKVTKQTEEDKEQNGDVRYLVGVQWCIEQRLEILGHSGGKAPKIVDDPEDASPPEPGTRRVMFTVRKAANGDVQPNE